MNHTVTLTTEQVDQAIRSLQATMRSPEWMANQSEGPGKDKKIQADAFKQRLINQLAKAKTQHNS